jgi:hypothetical protein
MVSRHPQAPSAGTLFWLLPFSAANRCILAPLMPLEFSAMPSLIRLLMVVGLLGGAAYGAMFALANFVQPKQREMSITIPQQRLSKPN